MSKQWYVGRDGVQKGPFEEPHFFRLVAAGKIRDDDQVWRTGMAAWLRCGDVPELAQLRAAERSAPGPELPPPTQAGVAPSGEPAESTPPPPGNPASERLATIALLVPAAASALIWLLVGTMSRLHHPGTLLNLLGYGTLLAIGVLVGVEASRLGVGGVRDVDRRGHRRRNGPVNWAAFTALFFLVGFPAYMAIRARYGARNRCVDAILSMLVFLFSWSIGSMVADQLVKRAAGGS